METCSPPHPPVSLPGPQAQQSHPQPDHVVLPRRCAGRAAHARATRAGTRHPRLWNALARAYAADSSPRLALLVCLQMPVRDKYTFPLAFRMCSLLSGFREGACLHAQLHKLGLACDVHSLNALLTLYLDGGQRDCARRLFDAMSQRTVASWTALFVGLERQSRAHEAMQVFRDMLDSGVRADEAAFVGALSACTQCGCLEFGASVHAHSIVRGLRLDLVALATALVDMYAKSGAIDISRAIFERMSHRNVLSWSAMIGGLAMHGLGQEALDLFSEMMEAGLQPTSVTMTKVLTACSHAGLVEEGWKNFALMREAFGIEPTIEHYGCMVNLLGRAGLLAQALEFTVRMPVEPSGAIWRSLLGAASTHGNLEVGELAMKKLLSVDDPIAGDYVMLANLYAKFNCWEDVGRVRTRMNDSKVRKVPGYSSLELDGVVHKFVMGDRSHPMSDSVYEMLGAIHEVLVLQDSIK